MPTTVAGTRASSSPKRSCAVVLSPTTWSFVTTVPFVSTTNPVPEPLPTRTETTPAETRA